MTLAIFLYAHGSLGHWLDGLIKSYYPAHYVAPKVPDGSINIDGRLDDPEWWQVPFSRDAFVDIAEPLFPDFRINSGNATLIKLAWDSNFLYVGAEIGEQYATGTVWGHNEKMRTTRPKMGAVPYFDNDFEVFVDVSMTNYYYKEFEVNFWNATYDVLWRGADSGLGSVGVPCDQEDSVRWCSNSTFYRTEAYVESVPPRLRTWSMVSDVPSTSGLQSRTSTFMTNTRNIRGWTVEIRFPLRSKASSAYSVGKASGDHGGLLDAGNGMQFDVYDPNHDAAYWLINFSRAEHPFFNFNMTDANLDQLPALCEEIMKQNKTLLGTDKWSCYWEWAWQDVGGHRYMHNPDTFGFLEFAPLNAGPKRPCRNIEWPVRFFLANIYHALIQYVLVRDTYPASINDLFPGSAQQSPFCLLQNGCRTDILRRVRRLPASEGRFTLQSNNSASHCVLYKAHGGAPRGGPCFVAQLSLKATPRVWVTGRMFENRRMRIEPHAHACLKQEHEVVTQS